MQTEYIAYGEKGDVLHTSIRNYMTPTEIGLYIEAATMNFENSPFTLVPWHFDNVTYIAHYLGNDVVAATVIAVTV